MARARLATVVAATLCTWLCGWVSLNAADSRLQIVSFTSAGCQPCKSMQPVLEKLAREGWQIRQVDVQEHPELVKHFSVSSLPTLVLLQERREVDRIVGTLGYAKLAARFEQASLVGTAPIKPADPNELLELVGPVPASPRGAVAATDREPMPNRAATPSHFDEVRVRGQSPTQMVDFQQSAAPQRSGLSTDERAQRATVRIKIEDANSIAYGTGTVINMHGSQA